MEIKVNGEPVETFQGAKVEDVLRSYSLAEYKKVKKGDKILKDKYGNQVMLNGELTGKEELYIEEKR